MLKAVRVGSSCKDSLQPISSFYMGRTVSQWDPDSAVSPQLPMVDDYPAITDSKIFMVNT